MFFLIWRLGELSFSNDLFKQQKNIPTIPPFPNASRQVSAKCRRDGGGRLETGRSRGEKKRYDKNGSRYLFFNQVR